MAWHPTDVPVAVRGPPKVEQAVCGQLYPQAYYLAFFGGLKHVLRLLFSVLAIACPTYRMKIRC